MRGRSKAGHTSGTTPAGETQALNSIIIHDSTYTKTVKYILIKLVFSKLVLVV